MEFDLVFEGGGAKGILFVGAMQELEDRGHSFDRLLGTSAGAITATLLAAGYSSDEMLEVLSEKKANGDHVFTDFLGEPEGFTEAELEDSAIMEVLRNLDIPLVPDRVENKFDQWLVEAMAKNERTRHLFSFVERGGWYSANKFVSWLENKLNSGTYQGKARDFGSMTLKQFFDATETELSLVVTDVSASNLLVLNHRTAPECPVAWAVRMSMSIPFIWPEVVWEAEWGTYLKRDITGHLIVDGGVLSNFPVELLISELPYVKDIMGDKKSESILGFLIDESMPLEDNMLQSFSIKERIKEIDPYQIKTVARTIRLLNTMNTAHDKMVIDAFKHLVVRLPAYGYGTTEFNMSDERRDALVRAGRFMTKRHFSRYNRFAAFGMGEAESEAPKRSDQDIADDLAVKMLGGAGD